MARWRLERRLFFGVALALVACAPPPPPPGALSLRDVVAVHQLAGEWEWIHTDEHDGAIVRERERWRFTPTAERLTLTGRYHREVRVRALDRVPFVCAQRPTYTMHADHEVLARIVGGGARIEERGYTVAPSPCDPGLRQLTTYDAKIRADRLILRWDGGEATLRRPGPTGVPAATRPATPRAPAGRWTWRMTSWLRNHLLQQETEDWELATSADGTIAGSYVRTTTVRSHDDTVLACASATSYTFVDRYLVRGRLDPTGGGGRFEEIGREAGTHPCLTGTSGRTRDDATFAVEGDHLVLEWRGKRRQVLARPWLD